MIPQTPRHDFLHALHLLLRPATYLEIGVQTGRSLAQAVPPTFAIGVDPDPQISVPISVHHQIFSMTSDRFFEEVDATTPGLDLDPYDLAFIDGMHLAEYALRDFMGVERHARPDGRTVAVFDDVLPYSADIAGRTPLPGDWAGDVWKVVDVLDIYRSSLTLILVNVAPTGALVVLGLDPLNTNLAAFAEEIEARIVRDEPPGIVTAALHNAHQWAVGPAAALEQIRSHLNITEA